MASHTLVKIRMQTERAQGCINYDTTKSAIADPHGMTPPNSLGKDTNYRQPAKEPTHLGGPTYTVEKGRWPLKQRLWSRSPGVLGSNTNRAVRFFPVMTELAHLFEFHHLFFHPNEDQGLPGRNMFCIS